MPDLAYNEVNDLIPNDVRSPEDLDDVLATIGTLGIDVLERIRQIEAKALRKLRHPSRSGKLKSFLDDVHE